MNLVFNIAKGSVADFYNNVQTASPANSVLVLVVLQAASLESDAILADRLTLASVLTGGTTVEATNSGYARIQLASGALTAIAPDVVNNRMPLSIPAQTWTSVAATGGAWGKFLVAYDSDSTSGTDANIVPMTMHDFIVTPDGSNITASMPGNFYRAS